MLFLCTHKFIYLLICQIEIKTAPADFRFPTTNQTRHCFTRYVEYHRYDLARYDFSAFYSSSFLVKTTHLFFLPITATLMEFRCLNAKGDDAGVCEKFAKYYRSLCPGEWVSISFYFWQLPLFAMILEKYILLSKCTLCP